MDVEQRKLTFFSDKPYLLDVYIVQQADSDPEAIPAVGLDGGQFFELVIATRRSQRLMIRRRDKVGLLAVERLSDRNCRVTASVLFPHLKFNAVNEKGKLQSSIRNGALIQNPNSAPDENPCPATGTFSFTVPYAALREALQELKARERPLA